MLIAGQNPYQLRLAKALEWQDVLGITKEGVRCKKQLKGDAQYCHWHTWQAQHAPTRRSDPNPKAKAGFIYMYTYKEMYDAAITGQDRHLQWLHMDYSIIQSQKSIPLAKWSSRDHILCKIGMTTKLKVGLRLSEWENSCKHEVIGLDPATVSRLCRCLEVTPSKKPTLAKLFQTLTLKDIRKPKGQRKVPPVNLTLKTFVNGGFYVMPNSGLSLLDIESKIHRMLWKRYGQGLIYCQGCQNAKNEPKRHKEWFMMPINHLPYILKDINSICCGERGNAGV